MIQSQTFLSFQTTIIPIQLTCLACFNAHMKYGTILSIAVKGLDVLHYTLIPSHCIQVDILSVTVMSQIGILTPDWSISAVPCYSPE